MNTTDDLAAARQCATEMASRNAMTFATAAKRAPGLLVGLADEVERLRAALRSIADFRPKSEQPAWGGPDEQIAAYAKQRARDALYGDAPAAGAEAAGGVDVPTKEDT